MTKNQKYNKWRNITPKSLEAELCSLPQIRIPEALKVKLMAGIPDRQAELIREHRIRWWPGVWGGVAAAAVLILALILMPSFGPSVSSKVSIADLNDKATRYILADQNSTLIKDTNYTSHSSRR